MEKHKFHNINSSLLHHTGNDFDLDANDGILFSTIAYDCLKRFIDITCGLLLLIISFPVLITIAVLIKIDSKGTIFFLQERCGLDGMGFRMYKFRTMIENAELYKKELENQVDGPMFKLRNDPRITRIGKFLRSWSLDELPQLINVLKGEMSLVGPRPLAIKEMSENDSWRETRLTVKPGITGLWQIKGRDSGKFSDWVKYDKEYVQNRSLFLDIKILFLTVIALFINERAH